MAIVTNRGTSQIQTTSKS